MTSLLPFKLLLPVNKEPVEDNWRCFVSAACAELAGRSHLCWLWAQHSLWGWFVPQEIKGHVFISLDSVGALQ